MRNHHLPDSVPPTSETLLTLQEAAIQLRCKYWQLQRAVKRGDVPSYTPFNSRKLVKLTEVLAYIDSCRQGGVT